MAWQVGTVPSRLPSLLEASLSIGEPRKKEAHLNCNRCIVDDVNFIEIYSDTSRATAHTQNVSARVESLQALASWLKEFRSVKEEFEFSPFIDNFCVLLEILAHGETTTVFCWPSPWSRYISRAPLLLFAALGQAKMTSFRSTGKSVSHANCAST